MLLLSLQPLGLSLQPLGPSLLVALQLDELLLLQQLVECKWLSAEEHEE
jgi:hypothetical protein